MSGYVTETAWVQCPHCWEMIEVVVDCSAGDQCYTEDCQVCCNPLLISVMMDSSGAPQVTAAFENE